MNGARTHTVALLAVFAVLHAGAAWAGCERASFRIVLDVGHSPESPGAKSARGIDEYRFNLDLAAGIETHLRHQGYTSTTRMLTEGGRATLGVRAAKANALRPDLFLSVHHDSVQKSFLETWSIDGTEQQYSDRFKGWSLFVSQANTHPRESAAFARLLADRLLSLGLPFTKHHAQPIRGESRRFLDATRGIYRFDELAVLKATDAPAVLMEAGLIVHRGEEELLAGTDRQNRVAAAVTDAVDAFCVSAQSPR